MAATFLDHLAQIVHGIEKDVIQLPDLGLDVARNRQVDDQHGAVAACLECPLDQSFADDRQWARGRRDDDVLSRDDITKIVERNHPAGVTLSQLLSPLDRAVGECHRPWTLSAEMRRTQLDHLARTDQQDLLLRDARVDPLRQAHGSRCQGNRALADLRRGSHLLSDRKGLLE